MYYPSSENKDADQLRGYREADLRLCFRICKMLGFSRSGSNNVMTTRVLTLSAGTSNVMTTSVTTMYFSLNIVNFKCDKKAPLKGHMINRILHSWSFRMKFIKLAEGSFDKFHMK